MTNKEDVATFRWQDDWSIFVDFLAKLIRGDSKSELATYFGSQRIMWSGVLVDKSIDELAPLVTIRMPKVEIDLGQMGVADVRDQSVPCARDSVSEWDAIPIGASVSFAAVFEPSNAIFPPVEVKQLASGRIVVLIGLDDGRPVAYST